MNRLPAEVTSFCMDCFFCEKKFIVRLPNEYPIERLREVSAEHFTAMENHKKEVHAIQLKNAILSLFKKKGDL